MEINSQEFQISLRVNFGESIYIYGQLEELGKWRRERALKMEWSENDIWSIRLNLQVEGIKKIEYGYFIALTDNPNDLRMKEKGLIRTALIREGEFLIEDRWDHIRVNFKIKIPKSLQTSKEVCLRMKTREFSEWDPPFIMKMSRGLDNSILCSKLLHISKSVQKLYISFFAIRGRGAAGTEKVELEREGDIRLDLARLLRKKYGLFYKNEYLTLDGNCINFYKEFQTEFSTYRFNRNIMFGPRPINDDEWRIVAQDCSYVVIIPNDKSPAVNEWSKKKEETLYEIEKKTIDGEDPISQSIINESLNLVSFSYTKNAKKNQLKKALSKKLISISSANKKQCIFIAWDKCKNFIFKSMIDFIAHERKTNKIRARAILRNYTMLKSLPDQTE